MNKIRIKCGINRMSKTGVTLPELIIGIIFTAIIFSTAVSIWFTAGKVFDNTKNITQIYSDARAMETMIQNAASVAPSIAFTSNLESSEDIFGNALPEGKKESDYFHFYYNKTEKCYCVSYYVKGHIEPMTIYYDVLDDVNDIRIGFSKLGNKIHMKYKLAQKDDGSYFIEGGIILNYASTDSQLSMRNLDYNLYFHVEEDV